MAGSVVSLALLAGGCARLSGAKAKETDAMGQRLAAIEGQIGALTQRIDEISQKQETASPSLARQEGPSEPDPSKGAPSLTNRQIQLALKTAGFYAGSIDGKMGPQTKEAVKSFQRSKGLKSDGVVGSKTSVELARILDVKASSQ